MSFNFTNTNMPGKRFGGIAQAASAPTEPASQPGAPAQVAQPSPAAPQGFGAMVSNARANQRAQAMAMPATPAPMSPAQPLVAPAQKGFAEQTSQMQSRQYSDSANPTGFDEAPAELQMPAGRGGMMGRLNRRLR
jgi:hypothetical protein